MTVFLLFLASSRPRTFSLKNPLDSGNYYVVPRFSHTGIRESLGPPLVAFRYSGIFRSFRPRPERDDRDSGAIPAAVMPHPTDGSRCLASVCNKQWSADTEESPNYSRNANVSRVVRRNRSKSRAFDVRGGDRRCPSRLETSGRSSREGSVVEAPSPSLVASPPSRPLSDVVFRRERPLDNPTIVGIWRMRFRSRLHLY